MPRDEQKEAAEDRENGLQALGSLQAALNAIGPIKDDTPLDDLQVALRFASDRLIDELGRLIRCAQERRHPERIPADDC